MSIKTTIPSNTRKPGTFVEFDVTSGARGLIAIDRRVALVAAKITAGTQAANTPVQIFSSNEADGYFGQGSELALMCRAALAAAAKAKKAPELWAVCAADPAATAATYTFTVTGTASAAGDVVFRIAGRTLRAGVAKDATATAIASAMDAAVDAAVGQLPVSGAPAAGVLTVTAINTGVNGNDIDCSVVSKPAGVSIAVAAGISGAGSYDLTNPLASLVDKTYHAVAVANHASTDVDDLQAHVDAQNAPAEKRFTTAYVGETGTLSTATTLASGANQMDVIVVSAEDCPNLPGEVATHMAVTVEAESDPAFNFDGTELDLYPPPAASVPTSAEMETAIAGGVTILGVNDTQDQMTIIRACTSKTTHNSVAFLQVLDLSNVRSLFYVAVQCDAAFRIAFAAAKQNARTRQAVMDVTYRVLKQCEELEITQNVDLHKGEILAETDPVVTTRINAAIPASVVPNLHQIASVVTLFVEG